MNSILFFLKQVVLAPYNLVAAPIGASNAMYQDSARGRAMMMGLPAVCVAVLATVLIFWATFGNKERLENSYDLQAQKSREKKAQVFHEIQVEQRKAMASQTLTDSTSDPAKKSPLQLEFDQLQNAELIYLNKLISLNPQNIDYRYRLAIATAEQGNKGRCMELMRSIAPETEPGYGKAHLWLAIDYLNTRPYTKALLEAGEKHIDYSLVRDANNKRAMEIKATLLGQQNKLREAYAIYEKLFRTDPQYFLPMYKIDDSLNENTRKKTLLDAAQVRFVEQIRKAADSKNEAEWANNWDKLTTILLLKREYQTAEQLLDVEEKKQLKNASESGTAIAASRHLTIRKLLVAVYNEWSSGLGDVLDPATDKFRRKNLNELTDDEVKLQMELLTKANSYEPNNPVTLRLIARISNSNRAIAAEAKKIYDPTTDPDAPPEVYNEMGSQALVEERYEDAIQYFENARRKVPNDPRILNNLAYAYLVCEKPNPDRALQLIDVAIRSLPNIQEMKVRRAFASNFFDTRGHALLQMDRLDAAAASFETALQVRPDEPKILEALVQCYEKLGNNDQAEVFQRRLTSVLEKKEKDENQDPSGSSN